MSLAPKFYFFDNGVTRALLGTLRDPPGPLERGRLFEQWFIQEVRRLNEYREKDFILSFWRTSHGAEVDLLVERAGRILCAVECKHGSSVSAADLSGLRSFLADHPDVPGFVAAPVRARRKIGDVIVEPPKDVLSFLEDLA
jgi:predicted AAA+ superfamily ATPase